MDLDSFEKEFRHFKKRVEPMLKEYEEHVGKRDKISPELWAEIHAPLKKPDAVEAEAEKKAGPSLKQWLESGKKASEYPPVGYPMVDTTQEELDAAKAAEAAGS